MRKIKNQNITTWYAVIVLIIGFLYTLALPVFLTPDEVAHFDTAYELSNRWMGKAENDTSEVLYKRVCDTVYYEQNMTKEMYANYKATFGIYTGDEYVAMPNTSTGTYVAAVVPAIGITLARTLHLSFGWMTLLTSLLQLVFFVAVSTYAIHLLPFGKNVAMAIALFPMTMQQVTSFSYDCQLIAASFLVFALALHWGYTEEKVKWYDVLLYGVGTSILLTTKAGVYAVIIILPFVFWQRKMSGVNRVLLWGGVASLSVIALAIGAVRFVGYLEMKTYLPWCDSYALSPIEWMAHPIHFVTMIVRSLYANRAVYGMGLVGGLLGYFDIVIPKFVVIAAILILLLAMVSTGTEEIMQTKDRVWFVLLGIVPDFLAMVAMLFFYTPMELDVIQGVQGRYFLPSFLILCMGIGLWKKPTWNIQKIKQEMVVLSGMVIVNLVTLGFVLKAII